MTLSSYGTIIPLDAVPAVNTINALIGWPRAEGSHLGYLKVHLRHTGNRSGGIACVRDVANVKFNCTRIGRTGVRPAA